MPPRRSSRAKPLAPAPVPPPNPPPQRKRARGSTAKAEPSNVKSNKRSKKRAEDDEKLDDDADDQEEQAEEDEEDGDDDEKEEEVPQQPLASAVPLDTMTSKVFDYSFIVQLMMEYLSDHDALTSLILTSHSVNRSVVRYPVKKTIGSQHELAQIKSIDLTSALANNTSFISPSHKRLCFVSATYRLQRNRSRMPFSNSSETLHQDPSWLPSTVTRLSATHFDPHEDPFPSHVTDLSWNVLHDLDKESIDRLKSCSFFPDHLKSLWINCMSLIDIIPPSVERLVLNATGKDYVLEVGVIPDTVKDLTLCGRFKPSSMLTSNLLPSGLIKLSTAGMFYSVNPLIAGSFPASITDLSLYNWNSDLKPGRLPSSLTRLEIQHSTTDFPLRVATNSSSSSSSSINQDDDHLARVIPDSVTELIYGATRKPNADVELQVGDLPPSLRVLDLGGYTHRLRPGVLPSTLEELTMRGNNGGYPLEAGVIPGGVIRLRLLSHPNVSTGIKPITPGVIPSSVSYLEWEYDSKSKPPIAGSIPSSVNTLVFGPLFSRALPIGFIPDSVRGLTFGTRFKNGSKPLEIGVIPLGVKYLRFDTDFDNGGKPLAIGVIPPTVTHLYFSRQSMFRNGFQPVFAAIPASVVVLELPSALKLDQPAVRPPVHKKQRPRVYRPNDDGYRWISASESDDDHEWFTYWEMRRECDD